MKFFRKSDIPLYAPAQYLSVKECKNSKIKNLDIKYNLNQNTLYEDLINIINSYHNVLNLKESEIMVEQSKKSKFLTEPDAPKKARKKWNANSPRFDLDAFFNPL